MVEKIKELQVEGKLEEAIEILEKYPEAAMDEDLLLIWGELLYAGGKMTEALNKFNAVLRIQPANRKAENYVTMIRNILDYYNKDLLNP